jgi:hypothetical protein
MITKHQITFALKKIKDKFSINLLSLAVVSLAVVALLCSCSDKKDAAKSEASQASAALLSTQNLHTQSKLLRALPENTYGYIHIDTSKPGFEETKKGVVNNVDKIIKISLEKYEGADKEKLSQALDAFLRADFFKPGNNSLKEACISLQVQANSNAANEGETFTLNMLLLVDSPEKTLSTIKSVLTTDKRQLKELKISDVTVSQLTDNNDRDVVLSLAHTDNVVGFSTGAPELLVAALKLEPSNVLSNLLSSEGFKASSYAFDKLEQSYAHGFIDINGLLQKYAGIIEKLIDKKVPNQEASEKDPANHVEESKSDNVVKLKNIPILSIGFTGFQSKNGFLGTSYAVPIRAKDKDQVKFIDAIFTAGGSNMFSLLPANAALAISVDGGLIRNIHREVVSVIPDQTRQEILKKDLNLTDKLDGLALSLTNGAPMPDLIVIAKGASSQQIAAYIKKAVSDLTAQAVPGLKWNQKKSGDVKIDYVVTPFGIGVYLGEKNDAVALSTSESGIELAFSDKDRLKAVTDEYVNKASLSIVPGVLFNFHIDNPKLSSIIENIERTAAMFTGGKPLVEPQTKMMMRDQGVSGAMLGFRNGTILADGYQSPVGKSSENNTTMAY